MSVALEPYVDQIISVITCDGRNIVGFLRGFDQTVNLILDECHERVYSQTAGVEQVVLGLYIIRGDNVSDTNKRKRTTKEEYQFVIVDNPLIAEPTSHSCMSCFLSASAIVGEVDEDKDTAIDFNSVRGEPLKPVVH